MWDEKVRKLAARRKQIRQMLDAYDNEVLDLQVMVDQLSQENGRLRLALRAAQQYNGTSPTDTGEPCSASD